MALIIDTGPLVAAGDRSDKDHQACASLLTDVAEPLIIPAPVLVEVDWVLGPIRAAVFRHLLQDIADRNIEVYDLDEQDYGRAHRLHEQYADLQIGFVDAAVLAVAERLNEPKLATLDHRHFTVMRPAHVSALVLLPA